MKMRCEISHFFQLATVRTCVTPFRSFAITMANNAATNSNTFGDDAQSLLTPKAFALALSAPRSPPEGTVHRDFLLAKDPSRSSNSLLEQAHSHTPNHTLRKRLQELMHKSHQKYTQRLPHPHFSTGPELGDQITRFLGVVLPVHWHNACRDSGSFRFIVDSIVTVTAPTIGITSPSIAYQFLQLTANSQRIRYGAHPRQYLDMYLPTAPTEATRLIFFVHGGAWGSGLPWFYRLTALPFLEQGWAVCVIGHRTYPDGSTIDDQVSDCSLAASCLADKFPELCERVTVMGHSSGAHLAMLMIVDRAKRNMLHAQEQLAGASRGTSSANSMPIVSSKDPMTVDSFVGLSGPYDISHHFDYEAARGVEELSPMKAVNGFTREAFRRNSPALRLEDSLVAINECQIRSLDNYLPKMVLVHGIEDDTVPFTATGEAARVLRTCGVTKCQEIYVAATGHQDTVMQIMLGGRTRVAVVNWIKDLSTNRRSVSHSPLLATSKL
jgi:acetyl esterase/lipase